MGSGDILRVSRTLDAAFSPATVESIKHQHQGPPKSFPLRSGAGDRQECRESESSTRHPTFYQDKHVRIFSRKVQKKKVQVNGISSKSVTLEKAPGPCQA